MHFGDNQISKHINSNKYSSNIFFKWLLFIINNFIKALLLCNKQTITIKCLSVYWENRIEKNTIEQNKFNLLRFCEKNKFFGTIK